MKICNYGCGREAKFYFKTVNKWCCSPHWSKCPVKRKEKSVIRRDPDSKYNSISYRKKISNIRKRKKHSEKTKKKIGKKSKLSIEKIKRRYPFFSQIEKMRYNPDKPGEKEIQVHCKNHLCKNSKEKGGWFTPTLIQLQERIRQLKHSDGNDGSFLYCSQKCKDVCPLYNLHSDPSNNTKLPYIQSEYQVWRSKVLERQKEEDGHNSCEKCESTENLHVHHEKPVKTHPLLALDPDNGIVLCEKCHYKYGHKTGTECSTGNLANKIC